MKNPNSRPSDGPRMKATESAGARRRSEFLVMAAMAAVLLVCAMAWRIPRHDLAVPANPKTIADLQKGIGRVERSSLDGGTLEIVLDEAEPLYEVSALTDLASEALVISHGLKEYFPDDPSNNVCFVARLPTKGIERFLTTAQVLSLTFKRSDLMAVDYDGSVKFQDLLNLVQSVGYATPQQRLLVRDFCMDASAKPANKFCQREAGPIS